MAWLLPSVPPDECPPSPLHPQTSSAASLPLVTSPASSPHVSSLRAAQTEFLFDDDDGEEETPSGKEGRSRNR